MKNRLFKLYLIILVLIPLVLIVLPSDFFDYGKTICLSVYLFNVDCYACGMTRAIHHLIHLDFTVAYEFNKLSVIVFPLLIISYLKEFKKTIEKIFNK